MKVTKKKVDANGVVTIAATASVQDVADAFDRAAITFAQQMGVKPMHGVPVQKLVEDQLGLSDVDSIVRDSAIERIVPFAIDKSGITPAFPPQPRILSELRRGREFKFELDITPKPHYELTSYEPVEITVQPLGTDHRAIERALEDIRQRYVEYVAVEPHPVEKGDSCLLKVESSTNGEIIPGLTFEQRTYTTGAGMMPEGFDENIIGMNVGETKKFSFEGPDVDEDGNHTFMTVDCTVTLLEVQQEAAPELNDDFVARNLPMYGSYQELYDDISRQVNEQTEAEYENYKRDLAAAELAKRFEGKIADEAYEAMSQGFLDNLRMQIQMEGSMTFEQFVDQQGGQQQFNMLMMLQTRQMLKQGYALDALYRHEHLVATDEDLLDACRTMDPQNPISVRKRMEREGRGFALREEAERIRASKWLLAHAKINYAQRTND